MKNTNQANIQAKIFDFALSELVRNQRDSFEPIWTVDSWVKLLIWLSLNCSMSGDRESLENFADSLGENPKNKERVMVIPDLDIPGIIANACPKPITTEVNNECSEFLFLKLVDRIKTRPVNNKAKPT